MLNQIVLNGTKRILRSFLLSFTVRSPQPIIGDHQGLNVKMSDSHRNKERTIKLKKFNPSTKINTRLMNFHRLFISLKFCKKL